MKTFVYVVTEGVLDVTFLVQILCAYCGGRVLRKKSDLPEKASLWLSSFKWPAGENIARRAVPAPAFLQFEETGCFMGIRNAEGLSNIQKTVSADMIAFSRMQWEPETFAIILDSDDIPPAKRFAEFLPLLHKHNYPLPSDLEEIAESEKLRSGIFAFPGKKREGTLEDLLLPLAAHRFPSLAHAATRYVEDWLRTDHATLQDFKEARLPSGRKKAILSSMTSLLKPAKPIIASIEDQKWLPETPETCLELEPFLRFLKSLLQ
jgi:hypothetical protein